jgi:hypothetical protein
MPVYDGRSVPRKYELVIDTALSRSLGSQPASPPTLKHRLIRIGSGPDLPPTPPAHSRNSSSSHSVIPSSPTYVESPTRSVENASVRPVTPPNQKSPPTPDVTPPLPAHRPRAMRPAITERTASKSTTTDSRTESFKTAREDPYSSGEEEDSKSTVRPAAPSARTSQNTVRQISIEKAAAKDQTIGLGLGLETAAEENPTPKSKREFFAFDGEWGSGSEVEQEWDDNLARNVTVKKRRPAPNTPRANGRKDEVIEDEMVTPTNATKALRSMPLYNTNMALPSPKDIPDRAIAWTGPSTSQSSISDVRRFSGMSSRSNTSTVVEAILVDGPPRRRKTLRHMKKQRTLRDSKADISPGSSAPNSSVALDETRRRPRTNGRYVDARHESYASNSTINSISSGRARREVRKNGGIPVVVIPDRLSSIKSKSSREPSLRSTSSRRSKRSMSLNSVPLLNGSKSNDLTPYFDRPSRRSQTKSESDGSDQRTIDYPPVVPRRTSSLSAPTSRNASRAGSLTADSLKSHNAFQAQQPQLGQPVPEVKLQPAPSFDSDKDESHHRLSVDRHGDPLFGKRLSAQNTPFSLASVDTNGTAPEVSEALAVSIFPHQNTSVLMVDHSTKPSEESDSSQQTSKAQTARPTIKTTAPDGDAPVTPPQPSFSMDDVDSPLRNPRAPPEPPAEPPAIKFIPATPSGLTPATERKALMGNYFEEMGSEKPQRSMSLVRMALTRRRHSEYAPGPTKRPGFLTRTLSLSRNVGKDPPATAGEKGKAVMDAAYPTVENPPTEGNKLHPFWRPATSDFSGEEEDWVHDVEVPEDQVYRYPPVDNRPVPRRNFSSRMKRTFAILPIKPEDEYLDGHEGPDRRTIRRTASGNLRVMRHRGSMDSFRQSESFDSRPCTAPDGGHNGTRHFWRGQRRSASVSEPRKSRILPAISNTLEGIQNLPRRISERRREKRAQELRQTISGPREVRDGVGEVIRRGSNRDPSHQSAF